MSRATLGDGEKLQGREMMEAWYSHFRLPEPGLFPHSPDTQLLEPFLSHERVKEGPGDHELHHCHLALEDLDIVIDILVAF